MSDPTKCWFLGIGLKGAKHARLGGAVIGEVETAARDLMEMIASQPDMVLKITYKDGAVYYYPTREINSVAIYPETHSDLSDDSIIESIYLI